MAFKDSTFIMPGLERGRRQEGREGLLLRPVVLGQIIDETLSPVTVGAAIPKAQFRLIRAWTWMPDGTRAALKLWDVTTGGFTGNTALYPPGEKVEFEFILLRNVGTATGRLFVRFRNAATNALLQEIAPTFQPAPGGELGICNAGGITGCVASLITMPDASLSLKLEAGHF